MKKIIIILMISFVFNLAEAKIINIGDTRDTVRKILGNPDLITTRKDIEAAVYPKKLNPERYRDKFEFWIYYHWPQNRKNWGYVEFNREGKVVDYLIHSSGEKVSYKVEGKFPGKDIFNHIGRLNGDDWNLMPDKSRFLLIIDIIDELRKNGVIVKKNPFYYLEEIASFYKEAGHGKFTVINTFYCFAVLNKDWDDGCDRNERIRKLLPSDMWGEFVDDTRKN